MAESSSFAHRVFIEDVRSDGKYLRVTWHPDLPGFIVSNWEGQVCVAATRVSVDDAPQLIALLANGMADALATERARPRADATPTRNATSGLRGQLTRARVGLTRMLRNLHRSTSHDAVADVVHLSQHRGRNDDEPRWASPDRQS